MFIINCLLIYGRMFNTSKYGCYKPPTSVPDLSALLLFFKTIIIGDCKTQSPFLGFNETNPSGRLFEDFVNSTPMEVVCNRNDTPTLIHYSRSGSNLDILLVSSDIKDKRRRKPEF